LNNSYSGIIFILIGHYINVCPTIGNDSFDRPKLKRTTGIPKMFLKTVEDKSGDGPPPREGVMVTGDGELVVVHPNE